MSSATGSARQRILGRVRSSLGVEPDDETRSARVDKRLRDRARHTLPARAEGDDAARRDLFAKMVVDAAGTVATVAAADDLPQAIADYLKGQNLPPSVRMGSDPFVAGLPWDTVPTLECGDGEARPEDTAGLSVALSAVAETGTAVLASGPDNPVTLAFLPETHIIAVPASRIHGVYEDAWDAVRAAFGDGKMPRTVNFITGPSRSADIEQTILMGAHGPKRTHVIVIEDA